MKTQRSSRSNRRGFTYASIVITMILVGALLASYLKLVAHQNQQTMRSQAWNRSVAVLEAGIEEALAHLNKNAAADSSGVFHLNLTADGWLPNGTGGWFKTNSLGEDYYIVTISQFVAGDHYPNITAEGHVKQLPTFASRSFVGPFLAQAGILPDNNGASYYTRRTVVCTTTNVPAFVKALVAKDFIDFNGNNIRTDSYNSANPLYSDNGKYPEDDPSKQRDNGDVASNNTITNSVDVGNANIYGRVATGPNGTVAIGPNGAVGDKAWHAGGNHGIKPGWSTDDMNVEFSDVTLPFTTGLQPERDKDKEDGVRYNYVFGSGTYVADTLNGKVLIEGTAKILVKNSFSLTGSGDGIWLREGASARLYMDGTSAKIGGNGVVNPGITTNFYYFGTQKNTAIELGGNGEFTGVIYAPNAAFTGNGGGSGSMDFCGAAMVRNVKFNGRYSFHYDEALPKIGIYKGYIITSWNEH